MSNSKRLYRMPEYTGIIKDSALKCTRPDLLEKWIGKNEGLWFRLTLKLITEKVDPKSAEQLGFYWGLLVPEITEQLNADGLTIPIRAFGAEAERPYFKDDTHELLTQLCNLVGKNGALMRLSDPNMDVHRMSMVLDNVIKFAVGSLHMNGEKLEAWRTK